MKLSRSDRRRLVLEALSPDANKTELARRFRVSSPYLYTLLNDAVENADERLEEAREELEFRADVKERLRERGN